MPDAAERGREEREERYSRQIRFAPIGPAGQRRLGESAVLIVGVGALGSSLAQQMARAGVGTVRLADRDYVETSNLQRQSLFDEEDARDALPKAVAAAAKLRRINRFVRTEPYVTEVDGRTAGTLLEGVHLVLDGTDNARTRLVLSDACFERGIPFIYGGVTGSEAMSAALVPGETACLRCLVGGDETGEPDATCETAGVIYPAVEFAAALQAAEALKWLSGSREAMRRTWVAADVWDFRLREFALPAGTAECPSCGDGPGSGHGLPDKVGVSAAAGYGGARPGLRSGSLNHSEVERREETRADSSSPAGAGEPMATVLCGRDTIQVATGRPLPLGVGEARLTARGCVLTARNPYLIRAIAPEGERIVLFADGRILVQGADATEKAVSLANRYVLGEDEPFGLEAGTV